MGRFGKDKGAPRVVGFDFDALTARSAPVAPAASPEAPPAEPWQAPVEQWQAPVEQHTAVATLPPPDAYPAPPYPAPAYPAPPGWVPYVEPPKQSNRTKILLGSLIVFFVIGTIGGIKGVLDDAKHPATATSVAVHVPDTIGGQPRMTGDFAERLIGAAREGLPDAATMTIGIYGRGEAPKYVFMIQPSSAGVTSDPLGEFASGARDAGVNVSKPRTFGDVVCGTAKSSTVSFAICAWSGHGTDGAVMTFAKTDLAKLAVTAKAARATATS